MGSTIGQVLPLALGILISPLSIAAVILILLTPRARANGLSFVAGWVAGLTLVGTAAIAVGNRTSLDAGGGDSAAARWIKAVLGVVLLVLAARQWQGRPKPGEDSPPPKWMSALDTVTPARAAGLGLLLSAVKPKNPLLTVAAAAVIVEAGLPVGQELIVLLSFVLVASIGVVTPLVVLLTMGQRAATLLSGWQAWLSRNNDVVMTVVMLAFGLILVALGVKG